MAKQQRDKTTSAEGTASIKLIGWKKEVLRSKVRPAYWAVQLEFRPAKGGGSRVITLHEGEDYDEAEEKFRLYSGLVN